MQNHFLSLRMHDMRLMPTSNCPPRRRGRFAIMDVTYHLPGIASVRKVWMAVCESAAHSAALDAMGRSERKKTLALVTVV